MSRSPVAQAATLIEARGLALGYGRRQVVTGIDLRVDAGDFWFLVGPNGTGKTTFVRALFDRGLVQDGALRLSLPRARVGWVPQRCELNPTLPTTVREFTALGQIGADAGLSSAERRARLVDALRWVGLEQRIAQSYWSLSGGQRQRCLVARALVRRPDLLLLDEPTAGLDAAAEAALLRGLAELNRARGTAILCVTHDLRLAAGHATHVALFGGGAVRAGPRAEVLTPDVLRPAYGIDLGFALREAAT